MVVCEKKNTNTAETDLGGSCTDEQGICQAGLSEWVFFKASLTDLLPAIPLGVALESKGLQKDFSEQFATVCPAAQVNLNVSSTTQGGLSTEKVAISPLKPVEQATPDAGARWTFVGVSPDTSFIHTLHHGTRNLEEATKFIASIKAKSNGQVPLFSSDDWFYEKTLLDSYSYSFQPPYKGRGRYPLPKQLPLPDLKYVQVQKKRDAKGRLLQVNYAIIYGKVEDIATVYKQATRCKTINTVYVESRNGKFRKDNARLIRKTLCHSKKSVFHDAQIDFIAQVMNYTRFNEALKTLIKPKAARFEQKYQHRTPAMAENIIDKPLTVKELLFRRPQIVNMN